MQVIVPIAVTDAMLVAHNVPEPDTGETEWASGTTYAAGDVRIRTGTHRKYRSLQAGNLGNVPETSPTWWEDIGGTNRWAMFDTLTSTASTRASPLTVEVSPGLINSIAAFGMVGNTLTITQKIGTETIYSKTISLIDGVPVASWWEYFFAPIEQLADVVLVDVPTVGESTITVSLSAASGNVQMGTLVFGAARELGIVVDDVEIGIIDYSRKKTDLDTGAITLERRSFAKRLSVKTHVYPGAVDAVTKLLSSLRAMPVVWRSDEEDNYEALSVFGFYRDFRVNLVYTSAAYCTLQIEGMN